MVGRRNALWTALTLALVGALLLGCGGAKGEGEPQPAAEGEAEDAGFPAKEPGQPFTVGERGIIVVTNDQAYEIQVQREGGSPLFALPMKKTTVVDPSVRFTVQTLALGVPEELAATYVAVGDYALELHAAEESGYGFALKPLLTIHFTAEEVEAAKQNGASLEPLKGNLLVLYKEQRSPKWVPQTSVSVDEQAKTVTVSNIAGAGAWRLAAKRAP